MRPLVLSILIQLLIQPLRLHLLQLLHQLMFQHLPQLLPLLLLLTQVKGLTLVMTVCVHMGWYRPVDQSTFDSKMYNGQLSQKSKRAWEKARLAYEQDRGICNPQPPDEPSEHRVGPGVPLLPNSFEETEWLVPPRDDTARLKARHAYDQWKQEAISLSSHDPYTSSGGRSISHPGKANGSAAKKLDLNRVVKPKGDRAWRKTSVVKLKANLDYRNEYCSPEGSDAQFSRPPKSSKTPRFKDTKWVVRPKGNSAWKKARISFAQRKKTNLRFVRETFQLVQQKYKHGRCWGSPSGAPRPTAE